MGSRGELALLFGLVHIVAMASIFMLLVMFLRSKPRDEWEPPAEDEGDEDDGGPGNDRIGPSLPRNRPGGGLPLPDAVPARVRLRGHERLPDLLPGHERRPAREPVPARRERTPA